MLIGGLCFLGVVRTFDLVLCEHPLFVFSNSEILAKSLGRVFKRKCPLIVLLKTNMFLL